VHARSKNPLLHPDLVFHLSSLGRRQAKYLATVRAWSKAAVEERAEQLLHDKGEETSLKQARLAEYTDYSLIQAGKSYPKPISLYYKTEW
jgi:hypothetical protein